MAIKLQNSIVSNMLLLLLTLLVSINSVQAITLDAFSYTQQNLQGQTVRLNSGNVGQTTSLIQTYGGAAGGSRSIQLTASHGGQSLFNAISYAGSGNVPSFLGISNSIISAGDVLLSYDGDSTAGLSNYRGLCSASGCLDVRQGNASGLQISVWYDYALNANMDLVFTFYDAKDTTGNTYSRGRLTLDRRYDNASFTELFLPFTSLTQFGSLGAANLSNIGAFSLGVQGAGKFGYDLSLANFRTNSSTTAVPEPTTVGLLLSGVIGLAKRRRKA